LLHRTMRLWWISWCLYVMDLYIWRWLSLIINYHNYYYYYHHYYHLCHYYHTHHNH
jgi:hypothetical protein